MHVGKNMHVCTGVPGLSTILSANIKQVVCFIILYYIEIAMARSKDVAMVADL